MLIQMQIGMHRIQMNKHKNIQKSARIAQNIANKCPFKTIYSIETACSAHCTQSYAFKLDSKVIRRIPNELN